MANKIKEIKNFFSGIISSFSSSDIKDDAASYSSNIDSVNKDGVLKGIKGSSIVDIPVEIDANIAITLEAEDDKFDLIYIDAEDGAVKIIEDLYGKKTITSPANASSVGFPAQTIEAKNDKVYVGYGKSISPKILYKTSHKPFSENDTNGNVWRYEDSSVYDSNLLNSSFNIDRFVGVNYQNDSTMKSAIGIRYDHKDVYFINFNGIFSDAKDLFDLSSGSKISLGTNENGKGKLQGAACDICQADVSDYQAEHGDGESSDYKFWVLSNASVDSESTNNFTQIHKFKLDENPSAGTENGAISNADSGPITVLFEEDSPPPGAAPGSILETKNHVWISYWKPNGDKFSRDEHFLFCCHKTKIGSTTAVFKSKSLIYDNIKKKSIRFTLGWFSNGLFEKYFYNSDQDWESLTKTDWRKGKESWGDKTSSRGNHEYSGIWYDGAKGITIERHGLIPSPLMFNEHNSQEYYLEDNPDLQFENDTEWVGLVGHSDPAFINILSAWQYRVPGGTFNSSYHKLRAADDGGSGSDLEGGNGFIQEFLNNVMAHFSFINDLIVTLHPGVAILFPKKIFDKWWDRIWGGNSVNWYYNGKCFETGYLKHFVMNISSEHNPTKKLNLNNGAQIHIRELYGWPENLKINAVRYFYNRLMISATNLEENDITRNSMFIMYDTSQTNVAMKNPTQTAILDETDSNLGLTADEREQIKIPDTYKDYGSTKEPRDNKILQAWLPIIDVNQAELADYGYLWGEETGQEIYPNVDARWWANEDVSPPINTDYLVNNNIAGDIYSTASATFNIISHGLWDGRKSNSSTLGLSSMPTPFSHIAFTSTEGPFNISKFNFLCVTNDLSSQFNVYASSQLNLPVSSELLYPEESKSIISLNQQPNSSNDENVKQYSLDSKQLSFRVKSHAYSGSGVAPFIFDATIGKELYRYKVNFVYDGYQDSPLSNHYTEVNITDTNVRHDGASDGSNITASSLAITLNLHKPEYISRRITHVRIWKSTVKVNSSDTDDWFSVPSAYTLVDTIPLNSSWAVGDEAIFAYNESTADTKLGLVASYTIIDSGYIGPSYEAYTGIPEAIKVTQPNYRLSTKLNGFLYIADCKHPSFEDASNLVFRSQPDKFNIFDWTRDYVSIPSTPRAITSFNGRVIVWDYNNMYIINPENLYIEDTFEGVGCLGPEAFARTEDGICFADNENIFMYDGREVKPIGIPIVTAHNYGKKISWSNRDKDYKTLLTFEPERRSYCIFFKVSQENNRTWLERSAKAKDIQEYQDSGIDVNRWFNIPGSELEFIDGQNPRYIWHYPMWYSYNAFGYDGYIDNEEYSDKDFYSDYYYEPLDITLPFGVGYDTLTGKYIVDMYLYVKNNSISGIAEPEQDEDLLFILNKGDYPDYTQIIYEGKLIEDDKDSYHCFMYNIDRQRWDSADIGKYKGIFTGAQGELYASQLAGEDYGLDVNALDSSDIFTVDRFPFGGANTIGNVVDLTNIDFENVGDINADENIDIFDVIELSTYNYIAVKGIDWTQKSYTILQDNGVYKVYYKDILIIDESIVSNYHRINVKWAFYDEDYDVSYILFDENYYPYDGTDYGWNTSSQYYGTSFPDGTQFVENTDKVILQDEYILKKLFSSDKINQFRFTSKNFSFESQTVNKLLSKIKIVYNNTPPKFQYMVNNNGKWLTPAQSEIIDDDYCLSYKIPRQYKKSKSIKLRFVSNINVDLDTYDTEIDSFSILFRERGNA